LHCLIGYQKVDGDPPVEKNMIKGVQGKKVSKKVWERKQKKKPSGFHKFWLIYLIFWQLDKESFSNLTLTENVVMTLPIIILDPSMQKLYKNITIFIILSPIL